MNKQHQNARRSKLHRISIKGYKSISYDNPAQLSLGDVSILLGANGAGKNNIISFFKMMNAMTKGCLQMFLAQNGGNEFFLHYGAKATRQLSAILDIETPDFFAKYSFTLAYAVSNRLVLTSETVETLDKKVKSIESHQVQNNHYESGLGSETLPLCQDIKAFLENCKVYQFSDSSQLSPMRQTTYADSAHYLVSDGSNLAPFLHYLKNNYAFHYKRIVSYVKSIMPQFRDFYLKPDKGYISLKWTDKSSNDYVFSSAQLPDGVLRYIALTTLLLQPKETMPFIIIIDEPELGLHPFAIDQFAYMVKEASLNAQVILSTQSSPLIDHFELEDIVVVEMDEDQKATTITKPNKEKLKPWLEDYTLSELWDKNVIGGRP